MKYYVRDKWGKYAGPTTVHGAVLHTWSYTTTRPTTGTFLTRKIPGIDRNFEGVLPRGTRVNIWYYDQRYCAVVEVVLGELLRAYRKDRRRIVFEAWAT